MKKLLLSCLIVCICKYGAYSSKLSGPLVYVVTPSSQPQSSEGRAAPAPFYYHNWMRRMDPPKNATTTTTTQSPDLIFAEFESGNKMKSIRKLLEKERVLQTSTTTARPIYVPEETNTMSQKVNYGLPPQSDVNEEAEKSTTADMTDYFALYNNKYNVDAAPVYLPSTTPSTSTTSTAAPVTIPHVPNVQNIWHIIDSQKHDDYSGKWEEVTNDEKEESTETPQDENRDASVAMDDNFALPGFGTNPGNGAENESRAIRTEPNIRFPYVNLKPFQIKTQKKPISNSKKGNNMYTNLDNFYDIKNPVRGEAQDVVPMVRQPVDRYNPAQPYLPQQSYGSKSKESSPSVTPMKAVANLVPPPPPPPRINDGDFPTPTSYESFPPYSPPAPPAPAPPPPSIISPPVDSSDDSSSDYSPDSDGPPDYSYRYKPPSPPTQPFLPTLPPLAKPYRGYSYNKPPMSDSSPGGGYIYDKPSSMPDSVPDSGYSYDKPEMRPEPAPAGGYSYDKSPMVDSPPDDSKPDFHGYHYNKPEYAAPPQDTPSSYGPGSDHSYGDQYPELIFDKPHGGKGGSDMKDVGMAPPPPPPPAMDAGHGSPAGDQDDQGFPHDFHGGDLKFAHDFDEHDHDYHYQHHHPTTTTTTETPRVNRYSYYYLGKKLYYLPLYFSVYFIIYVGALIIKAVLRHKIVYPNSWRPNTGQTQTSSFFSKRSIDSYDFSNEHLHEITGQVTHAIAEAGKKYFSQKRKKQINGD